MWCFLCISFKLGSSGPKGRVEIRSPCFSPLWSRFSFIAGPFPYKLLSQIAAIKDTFGLIFQTLFHFSWSCTNCILEEVLMTIPLPAITWDRRKEHTFCWTVMWNGRGARGGEGQLCMSRMPKERGQFQWIFAVFIATKEKRLQCGGSIENFLYREIKQRFAIEPGEQFPRDL